MASAVFDKISSPRNSPSTIHEYNEAKMLYSSTSSTAATVALICIVITYIRSYLRLRHIPGPILHSWTIWPWLIAHTKHDLLEQNQRLSDIWGPLVRVGPNTLICSDANVIRRMSAPRSPYTRSDFYYTMRLNPGHDHIFSLLDEDKHNLQRRKMAAGYAGKENETLEKDIDERILRLIELIERKYISLGGQIKPMDLAEKISFLTLDIISKIAFDGDFEDLKSDADNFGYLGEVAALLPSVTWIATVPGFAKLLTRTGLLQLAANAGNGDKGAAKLKTIAYHQVDKRYGADGTLKEHTKDMLGCFLRHGMSRDEAKQESILNMTAGSETSATVMRAIILGTVKMSSHLWDTAERD